MSWHTIDSAAAIRGCTKSHIYRLVKSEKIQFRTGDDGEKLVYLESDEPVQTTITSQPGFSQIEIPVLPNHKITPEVNTKVEQMLSALSSGLALSEVEGSIPILSPELVEGLKGTQAAYKTKLRKLFNLPKRAPLSALVTHPQIRQALEYVIARRERSDKNTLRSAKEIVIAKANGECISLEEYLLAPFAWEKHNATSAYRTLIELCERGSVLFEKSGTKCTIEDLPAESTVVRWLYERERQDPALRRARMTKSQWEAKEMVYIARKPEQYRPGGYLYGDHTELDNLVYRLDGPIGTITTGHLWVTMFIDYRTSLPKAWVLSRQPNSLTIAQAFRSAVLGTQLRVATKEGFVPIGICDAPEDVGVDRGKDYKSKYTQQVISQAHLSPVDVGGQISFDPDGELCVKRISNLHYVTKHHPQSKAQQERFFRTIQEITRYLPGYKGSKYQDKPDELKKQVERWELLTEEEFIKKFDEAVWAYSNRPRRALNGMSPMEFYLRHQQYVRRIDERVLDFLMMKSDPRKVHRGYVVVDNITYFSLDLEAYTGKSAVLYRDPQDLGHAAVYIDSNFVTVAINKDAMGITEHDRLKWVKARAEREKLMMGKIKLLRQGMSSKEIKQLLFAGETKNVKHLELEVIKKQIDQRLVVTGLEGKAEQIADEMASTKQQAKDAKEAKKKIQQSPIFTPDTVKDI